MNEKSALSCSLTNLVVQEWTVGVLESEETKVSGG